MAAYPIPPWLSPQAAQGYGDLAAGAQRIQLEREKISSEAQQHAMDIQQRQQELAQRAQIEQEQAQKEGLVEQQKIQIDKSYKDAELGLRQQDLDLQQKQFQQQAQQAAQRYSATQSYQKRYTQNMLPKEQGGKGMNPHDAAIDASQEIVPYMTPDAVGRMANVKPPFTLGAPTSPPGRPDLSFIQTTPNSFRQIPAPPSTATNAPAAIPVKGDDGSTIGNWVIPPDGGKAHWQSKGTTKTSGLDEAMKKYQEQKAGAEKAEPLPSKKSDLKKGVTYQTNKGKAEWDGEKFVVK